MQMDTLDNYLEIISILDKHESAHPQNIHDDEPPEYDNLKAPSSVHQCIICWDRELHQSALRCGHVFGTK